MSEKAQSDVSSIDDLKAPSVLISTSNNRTRDDTKCKMCTTRLARRGKQKLVDFDHETYGQSATFTSMSSSKHSTSLTS